MLKNYHKKLKQTPNCYLSDSIASWKETNLIWMGNFQRSFIGLYRITKQAVDTWELLTVYHIVCIQGWDQARDNLTVFFNSTNLTIIRLMGWDMCKSGFELEALLSYLWTLVKCLKCSLWLQTQPSKSHPKWSLKTGSSWPWCFSSSRTSQGIWAPVKEIQRFSSGPNLQLISSPTNHFPEMGPHSQGEWAT